MPVDPKDGAPPILDVFVSLVTVLDATVEDESDVLLEAQRLAAQRYSNYEIVAVDNGMEPEQLARVRQLLREVPCVRILRLSRPFPYDTAVFSALESAIGDYVVVFEADRDPIGRIPDFVSSLVGGADIVQGMSQVRQPGNAAERIGRRLFYRYNARALGVRIPENATYFTGFSRRAVNSLTSTTRQYRYLRHLMRYVGYAIVDLPYAPRPARSRGRGISDAVEMVTSYSLHPLRVVSVLGLVVAGINLLYALYVVIVFFAVRDVEQGWTTSSLQSSTMFFFLFLTLAILSEYVGRLLAETRREPAYFIMEEMLSDQIIADGERRNIA